MSELDALDNSLTPDELDTLLASCKNQHSIFTVDTSNIESDAHFRGHPHVPSVDFSEDVQRQCLGQMFMKLVHACLVQTNV